MAIKSIIDIDINDAAFARFKTIYDQYEKQLAKQPAAWKKISETVDGTVSSFQELVGLEVAALGNEKMLEEAQRRAARITRTNADAWRDAARHTRVAAVNVADMTRSLLKWTALTSVFTGLLGAGGLFGISRMAEGVAAGRRQSMGTGVSYGQQKAFETNYSSVVDPQSFLSSVNESLRDVTKRHSLYGAGLREEDLQGGTADVAVKLIDKMKTLADKTPDNLLGNVLRAVGGDQHFGLQDFQRLKATSRRELAGMSGAFGRDSSALNLGGGDQRAWTDFTKQMSRAGQEIENVFVRGLTPLAPGLEKLSDGVAKTVKVFLESDDLKKWIKDIGGGLETFAKYIGTPEFKTNVESFVGGIGRIGNAIAGVIGWMGGSTGANGDIGPTGAVPTTPGQSKFNRLMNSAFTVKPGAGDIDAGLGALAERINGLGGVKRFTSFNDNYHKGTGSAHADGRGFDFTIDDPKQSAAIAQKVRDELARLKIAGKVIDEYANPSRNATAGHIHVQTDARVKVDVVNNTGGSAVVNAQQAAQ